MMKIQVEKVPFLILIFMVLVLLFNASGCKNNVINNTENPDPEGELLSYAGCKGGTAGTFQGRDVGCQDETECIIFEYSGNTLNLKHVNAYLNCCPGEITADISFQGQSIVITEKEAESGCFCNCYYDIDYKFNGIVGGTYTILIQYGNVVRFECTIDLASTNQGEICN